MRLRSAQEEEEGSREPEEVGDVEVRRLRVVREGHARRRGRPRGRRPGRRSSRAAADTSTTTPRAISRLSTRPADARVVDARGSASDGRHGRHAAASSAKWSGGYFECHPCANRCASASTTAGSTSSGAHPNSLGSPQRPAPRRGPRTTRAPPRGPSADDLEHAAASRRDRAAPSSKRATSAQAGRSRSMRAHLFGP